MANDSFRFKQFDVRQDRCAMKVGTDGVLLGAWAMASKGRPISVLDIGTGTGLVAMMMAQRFPDASVCGIEISSQAAQQAAENAANSAFGDRIRILETSLQDFVNNEKTLNLGERVSIETCRTRQGRGFDPKTLIGKRFDSIVCNPPFFSESLECPDEQRNMARHTNTLDAHTLVACAARLLAPGGQLSVVVPYESKETYDYESSIAGLFISRVCTVSTKPGILPKRVLLAYTNAVPDTLDAEQLVIGDNKYKEMTAPFYLE